MSYKFEKQTHKSKGKAGRIPHPVGASPHSGARKNKLRKALEAREDKVTRRPISTKASHSLTKTARQRAEHPSDRHKETAKQKAARIKAGGPTKQKKHKATGRLGTRRIAKRHEQAMPEGTSIYDVDKQKTKKIPTVKAPKGSTKRRPTSKEKAADKRKYPSVLKKAGGGKIEKKGTPNPKNIKPKKAEKKGILNPKIITSNTPMVNESGQIVGYGPEKKYGGGKVKGYKHGGFLGKEFDGSKIVSGGYD